jgi:hypothetical protein
VENYVTFLNEDNFDKMNPNQFDEQLRKEYDRINKERHPDLYDRQPKIPAPPTFNVPDRGIYTIRLPEEPK